MAEYIEREAAMLTPVLPKEYRRYQTYNLDDAYELGWEDALNNLKNAPAADVAPVVRCRDCIYTRKLYGRLVCKYGTCSGCILREDFFCANGVTRKDGDSDALD